MNLDKGSIIALAVPAFAGALPTWPGAPRFGNWPSPER